MSCQECKHDVSLHEFIPVPGTRARTGKDGSIPYWFMCKGCALDVKGGDMRIYACRKLMI